MTPPPVEEPDIVRVILERVVPLVPEDLRHALGDLEQQLRGEYGGLRVRIPKRRRDLRGAVREQAYRDALDGLPETEMQARYGISRRSLYRLVKRGPAYRGDPLPPE